MVVFQRFYYNSPEQKASLALRDIILRKPLGMNLYMEDLSQEEHQHHFLAMDNDICVGVVLLAPTSNSSVGKLRQMATAEEVRGKGYGKELVNTLERFAMDQGIREIELHARHHAVEFYRKLGYEVCSEAFEEVGIEHFKMHKILSE